MNRFLYALFCLLLSGLALAQSEPQPIVRTQLDKVIAAPGQRIVLQITVLVPTWQTDAPVFPEFESPSLIVRLPPEASFSVSERIDNELWSGVSKTYHLYPMVAGRFGFPPKPVNVTYAHPETRKPVIVKMQTEAIEFEGRVPAGAEDLHPFLAAEALTLNQKIVGNPLELEPGDAIKRTVTAKVLGAASLFLPPMIKPLDVENISVYADEPEVNESSQEGKTVGERIERATYVAAAGVSAQVPAIELRWWNLNTEAIETSQLDGFEIHAHESLLYTITHLSWRVIVIWILSVALVIGLLLVLFVRLRPKLDTWWRALKATYLASEAYAYAQAQAAIRARNFAKALRAIDLWSGRLASVHSVRQSHLSEALARLGAAYYRGERMWSSDRQWTEVGSALRNARREYLAASRAARTSQALPPLNP